MPQVRRQARQLGFDIGSAAVPVQQGVHRKRVAQIVVVPTSAQARLCRPLRYADLGAIALVAQGIPPDGVGITTPHSIIVSFAFATRRRRAWSGQRAG